MSYFRSLRRCLIENSAWSTVPHSTDNTMSRLAFRQIRMTRAQSITPSPQAHPTGRAGHLAAFR